MFRKNKDQWRWPILAVISLAAFGCCLAYDTIGPIAPMLSEYFRLSRGDIGLLYSIYSVPNLFMVFGFGYLADRIGTRRSGFLCMLLMLTGAAVIAWAPYIGWHPQSLVSNRCFFWLFTGRFLLGLGSESVLVICCAVVSTYFKNKELTLAFGLYLTLSHLGAFCAFFFFGWLAQKSGSPGPVLSASFLIVVVSFFCFICYILMDRRFRDIGARKKQNDLHLFRTPLPRVFWYLALSSALFYAVVYPFSAFCTDFLYGRGYDLNTASKSSGLPMMISLFTGPLLGLAIDRYGKRKYILLAVAVSMFLAFALLLLGVGPPQPALCLLGFSFSIPLVVSSCMPLVVRPYRIASAYAIVALMQNFGLVVMPLVIGYLKDRTGDYGAVLYMLLLISLISVAFAGLFFRARSRFS